MTKINAASGPSPHLDPGLLKAAGATVESSAPRMAEDGLANRAGRVLGLKATPLDPRHLAKEIKFGVVSGVPVEALMISQAYRRGDITAKTYAAQTISNSISFGAWTVGGALVGAMVPGGSLIGGALGFAGGMLSHSAWNRTVGKHVTSFFEKVIPEGVAKAFGDNFNRFVANPLTDYVWKPVTGAIKKHKVLAGILGAGALMMLPGPLRVGLLKAGVTMAGGTALGLAGDAFVLDKFLPAAPAQPGQGAKEAPAQAGMPTGSALGEYEAALQIDESTRAVVRQSFPQVFQPGVKLPAGLEADLEKVFYVKLVAMTSQDPARAQQLEATFQALAARVDAHWNGGVPVAAPSGLASRSLTG